jgi:hypothetical protein
MLPQELEKSPLDELKLLNLPLKELGKEQKN